jgi:hypothetical protein
MRASHGFFAVSERRYYVEHDSPHKIDRGRITETSRIKIQTMAHQ